MSSAVSGSGPGPGRCSSSSSSGYIAIHSPQDDGPIIDRYGFEWDDEDFFKKKGENDLIGKEALGRDRLGMTGGMADQAIAACLGNEDVAARRLNDEHQGMDGTAAETVFRPPWQLSERLERFFVMEVAWGSRQAVEVSVGDILKKVRSHKWHMQRGFQGGRSRVPEITYRDLTQLFNESALVPAFEIRQNCIVMCLPPLTCIVLHDRVILHVNNFMDPDTLLLKLEHLTAAYSKRADDIQQYFLREHKVRHHRPRRAPFGVSEQTMGHMTNYNRSMLLSGSCTGDGSAGSPPVSGALLGTNSPLDMVPPPLGSSHRLGSYQNLGGRLGGNLQSVSSFAQMSSQQLASLHGIPKYILFPLEFALLEVLISYAFAEFSKSVNSKYQEISALVEKYYVKSYDRKLIDQLTRAKGSLSHMSENVQGLKTAFNTLLNTPEDLAMMELTKLFYLPQLYYRPQQRGCHSCGCDDYDDYGADVCRDTSAGCDCQGSAPKRQGSCSGLYQTEDSINPNLEILMEFFTQEIGQIAKKVKKMNSIIVDAEKHITFTMGFRRNELHKWDIGCNVATVTLGIGSVVSGLLGMNVPNFQEEDPRAFPAYVISVGLTAVCGFVLAFWVAFKTTN